MSKNENGEDIDIRASSDGPTRGAFPTQPKRPEAPSFDTEDDLMAAIKGAPVSLASLRISMFAHRINKAETGTTEAMDAWKADYRRLMDKWRKSRGRTTT
jgi:hypothetical protein